MTFFPWPSAPKGRPGAGQVTGTAFAIPAGALPFWTPRLKEHGIAFEGPFDRFGEQAIAFFDPDGLRIELVATNTASEDRAWQSGPIPVEYAIRGFHSATLTEADLAGTAKLLTGTMGFKLVAQDGARHRYIVDSGQTANIVDVIAAPEERHGRVLVGSVHHIAWRAANDEQQLAWLNALSRQQYSVTPVIDRKYFHSIYFREPGNVLFEIATDPPGFGVDEAVESLGSHLVLPPWLEPQRARLEAVLPPLTLPGVPVRAGK